ncbi:hypothetical protein BC830DRAFT_73943 [Chytriomyces sp. MP71]|nr:hypothetical protein BC830DRAFT_73943 [Chytriomyces sp. MP71]
MSHYYFPASSFPGRSLYHPYRSMTLPTSPLDQWMPPSSHTPLNLNDLDFLLALSTQVPFPHPVEPLLRRQAPPQPLHFQHPIIIPSSPTSPTMPLSPVPPTHTSLPSPLPAMPNSPLQPKLVYAISTIEAGITASETQRERTPLDCDDDPASDNDDTAAGSPPASPGPTRRRSLGVGGGATATKPQTRRGRKYTRLTSEQRRRLGDIFERDANPRSDVIRALAEEFGVRYRLLQYHFQNKRRAARRA